MKKQRSDLALALRISPHGKSSERLSVTLVPPVAAPAGWPSMGHPAHLKASPRKQFPHALLNAFFSSSPSCAPPAAASTSARPHEQFLHAVLDVLQPSPAALAASRRGCRRDAFRRAARCEKMKMRALCFAVLSAHPSDLIRTRSLF